MPPGFARSTAELTIQVAEAVRALGNATVGSIEEFCDLPQEQARNALELALELGLIQKSDETYAQASCLLNFISSPDESRKAAILRVVLESFSPFVNFRERLRATGSADTAAQQTKAALAIDAHREDIKETLISLGTYANALRSEGGGRYSPVEGEAEEDHLQILAEAAADQAAAENAIRDSIGTRAESVNREEVITPLGIALLRAQNEESREAVTEAARAVESFLVRLAQRVGVNLDGATGMNQFLGKFRTGNHLPKKLVESARYLGQIRNAADHGVDVDPDVGDIWHIQQSTGLLYVFVACSFMAAALEREAGGVYLI